MKKPNRPMEAHMVAVLHNPPEIKEATVPEVDAPLWIHQHARMGYTAFVLFTRPARVA